MDFSLTHEQYMIIQHHLPKRYALIEHKNIKKGVVVTSAVKLGPEEVIIPLLRPRIFHEFQEVWIIQMTLKVVRSASALRKWISS